MWLLIWQRMAIEFALDLVTFPLWWYTVGTRRSFLWCLRLLKSGNRELAPGLWLKNIFVPMYGQYDWQGRIMSFFMRLVNVLFRGIAICIWLLVVLALFAIWLALPPVIIFMMLRPFLTFS